MKKGQISAEYVMIAAMVLATSFLALKYFQTEGYELVSESLIKSMVDWKLSTSSLDNPKCDIFLAGIYANRTKHQNIFEVQASNFTYGPSLDCTTDILSQQVINKIQSLISASLGCDPATNGSCNGYIYTVKIG